MTSLYYNFKTPDPSRPLSGDVPSWGPTCELIDFPPAALAAEMVVGRTVEQICTHVGTYGMGGPGFFGLRLGSEWLVIAIWGADSWIEINGRIVQDGFWDTNERPRPWITDEGDELTEVLIGQQITSFKLAKHSLTVGIRELMLSIQEAPEGRPILEGSNEAEPSSLQTTCGRMSSCRPRSNSGFEGLREQNSCFARHHAAPSDR